MRELLQTAFGNPSSSHWAGCYAADALRSARTGVANAFGCLPEEIVFTSGGSEANNLALKGAYLAGPRQGFHIVTSSIEHPAVIEPCRFLESLGARVTYLPVDRYGRVNPDDLVRAIEPSTGLVSIMHANNEVGTIQPIAECARIARSRGVLFHTDAAQTAGKISTNVSVLGVDLMTIAAHKFGGPKGVGALYVRRGVHIAPLIHGAGHESGRRAGTESVLLASGLAAACTVASDLTPNARIEVLRDKLWAGLQAVLSDRIRLNGHPTARLPNTLNVSFVGSSGADVLAHLKYVAASTGSACHSGSGILSPTLAAMGVDPQVGMGAIRFSLGRSTKESEIERVLDLVAQWQEAH
jgi:cysteine desulfurase